MKPLGLPISLLSFIKEQHAQSLAKRAGFAFALKALGVLLSFILNLLIARKLGPSATGQFYLTLTAASIAGVIGCLGLENTFLRHVSAGVSLNNWGAIKGLYSKGLLIALPFSVVLTAGMFYFSLPIAIYVFNKPGLAPIIKIMSMATLPTVLILLHAELLKGLQRTFFYLLIHSISVPAISILAFFVLCLRMDLGVTGAVWGHLLASCLTALLGVSLWRWISQTKTRQVKGLFEWRQIFKSNMPLFWVTLMNFIMMWSTTLFLGVYGNSNEVGIYATAYRVSLLTSFVLIAVNTVAAPKYAELYSLNQMQRLEETALASVKVLLLFSVPPLILFIFFPHWIMGFFGNEFSQGGRCLSILACGQFINVATGSVGYILMMSGHEKLMRNAITVSGVLNVVLNLILVPRYGIIGGAAATAISVSILNTIAAYYVWAAVKIKPFPLPFISSRYESMP